MHNEHHDFRSQQKSLLSDDGNRVNHPKVINDFDDLNDDDDVDTDVDVDLDDYTLVLSKPNTESGSGACFRDSRSVVRTGSIRNVWVMLFWFGSSYWGSRSVVRTGFGDHRKLLVLVVMVVFLAPLCVLDRIDSLSMTSAASVALAVVFVVVCFAVAFIKLIERKIEAPRRSPDFGSKMAILDLLVVIPIMTNAYVCHFNVQPIHNELEGDVLTNFDRNLGIRFSTALNYICSSFGSGFPCYSLFSTANYG
ncbi:hypothetical protein PVK06_001970 [Gossypium arboreum]|uniref:Amino acid transporter transmembrane domain-containing protein n=1 Tax=Gossypium arboreum TaxID=29729 RepID=A0ABR0R2J4_GOSAR|nr:hypothetical protein PVK06_001970 [Gossypium arboreum]